MSIAGRLYPPVWNSHAGAGHSLQTQRDSIKRIPVFIPVAYLRETIIQYSTNIISTNIANFMTFRDRPYTKTMAIGRGGNITVWVPELLGKQAKSNVSELAINASES